MRCLISLFLMLACTTVTKVGQDPVSAETAQDTSAQDLSDDPAPSEGSELDLDDPEVNAQAYARVRGSLDPDEHVYYYWSGYIYSQQDVDPYAPGQSDWGAPILRFDGFNVARLRPSGDGYFDVLTREVSLYRNMQGQIIDCWNNAVLEPDESDYVRVLHVQNDPVNFTVGSLDYVELGETLAFSVEVPLTYVSPLPVDEYPLYSASNTYQSTELFNFYTLRADLEDASQLSVPAHISWVRVGQYLPWMKVGQLPGKLVYHAQGYKVMDGWDGLPEDLREWVQVHAPEFQEAPGSVTTGTNMTSWRYFDWLMSEGKYDSACE